MARIEFVLCLYSISILERIFMCCFRKEYECLFWSCNNFIGHNWACVAAFVVQTRVPSVLNTEHGIGSNGSVTHCLDSHFELKNRQFSCFTGFTARFQSVYLHWHLKIAQNNVRNGSSKAPQNERQIPEPVTKFLYIFPIIHYKSFLNIFFSPNSPSFVQEKAMILPIGVQCQILNVQMVNLINRFFSIYFVLLLVIAIITCYFFHLF